MDGHYVIAIDVGIKNIGMCVFDFLTSSVVFWTCESLVSNGKYIPSNNVLYVHNFIEKHSEYFDNAWCVVVERQMRCNMRIVEAILHSRFYSKCEVISARSIKMHYDLSTKNYKANKLKAVEWVTEFIRVNPQAFKEGVVKAFEHKGKRDDLADALLLVIYYLDTYSNQQFKGFNYIYVIL